jgi:lipopolysaccharide transport system ATP-binding protein
MSVAIKFENISKQYRLGEVGTGTLSHDLHRAWAKLRGKPDPFTKVGQINDRTVKSSVVSSQSSSSANCELPTADSLYVWALRDINFEVQQGEILGIIGRNGAGKSTLLKLLSRVTAPTTGSIKAKGRIASLLEVGTGFHPELTGRENIYLNGAILGMRRHEITRKLEEIVEFSGCAKYIDTPVKRYSSGMTVRLGFAVAAHLDCEILVVDEVLAVGDAEFQKKCIGKMKEVSETSGKTVLFVSHNMASIERLCSLGVLMNQGSVSCVSNIVEVIENYLALNSASVNQELLLQNADRSGNGQARIRRVQITDLDKKLVSSIRCGSPLRIQFEIENTTDEILHDVSIGYSLSTPRGEALVVSYSDYEGMCFSILPGTNHVEVVTDKIPFRPGTYHIGSRLISNAFELDWPKWHVADVMVEGGDIAGNASNPHSGRGVVLLKSDWHITDPTEATKAATP